MRQEKRTRDLSVECGYYDEFSTLPCSVVTNVLLLKRYGTPVRNIMWIKARYKQNNFHWLRIFKI